MRKLITEFNGAFFLALGALGWLCSCSTAGYRERPSMLSLLKVQACRKSHSIRTH